MATTTVAAAGTALALYFYSRRQNCQAGDRSTGPTETHTGAHSAPRSFMEDLYFFAEGLRYTYGETLGRWRTADLLIGLAYLCRKDLENHPVEEIARLGRPFARGLTGTARAEALAELARIERFFRYCSGLRERRPLHQRKYVHQVLRIPDEDILRQELRAGVLKPSYLLTRDSALRAVVLAVRGTHSFKDAFTSLTGASKPHHVADANNVVLGYSHFGMLAAARWLKAEVAADLEAALAANPGYRLYIVGHSLGGGTAAMLTMMLRERGGCFAGAECVAIACPACMTLELARSCSAYVTTVVNNADVIPTICPGSADALRVEVMNSSWFQEFRSDVRSSGIVKAVESGIRGMGSATATATSWTTARLSACVSRRPSRAVHKRRNSDDALGQARGEEGWGSADRTDPLPMSSSAPERTASVAALLAGGQSPASPSGAEWTSLSTLTGLAASVGSFTGRQVVTLGRGVSAVGESAGRLAASSSEAFMGRWWWGGTGGGTGDGTGLAAIPGSTRTKDGCAGSDSDGGEGEWPAAAAASPDRRARRRVSAAFWEDSHAEGTGGGQGGGVVAPPELLQMDFEFERLEYMEVEAVGAAARRRGSEADQVQVDAMRLDGSLEAEANVRMAEVAQAVSAAEAEERAAGAALVPSVITPGDYGSGGADAAAAHSSGRTAGSEAAWRRAMFPAGRIMHLVPVRLVPGLAGGADAGGPSAAGLDEDWPEARMEEGEDYPGSPLAEGSGAVGEKQGRQRQGEPADELEQELSLSDMLGPGSAATSPTKGSREPGSVLVPGDAEAAAAAAAAIPTRSIFAIGAPAPEPMVMLEDIPHEAYSRIRLCRTVLSDHIIPHYLRSLESAVTRI